MLRTLFGNFLDFCSTLRLAVSNNFLKRFNESYRINSSFGFIYYNAFSQSLGYEESLFHNLRASDNFIVCPNPRKLGKKYSRSQIEYLYSLKNNIVFLYRDDFISIYTILCALISYTKIPLSLDSLSYNFSKSDSFKRRVRCFATRPFVEFIKQNFHLNHNISYILTENQPQEQFLFKCFFESLNFTPYGVLFYYFTPFVSSSIIPSTHEITAYLAPQRYIVIGDYCVKFLSAIFPSSCHFLPHFVSRVKYPILKSKVSFPSTNKQILVLLPYSLFYSGHLLLLLKDVVTCGAKFFIKPHPSIPPSLLHASFSDTNLEFLASHKSINEEINSRSYDGILSIISSSALELLPLDLGIAYYSYLGNSTFPFNQNDSCFSCISILSNSNELVQWVNNLSHKSYCSFSEDKSRVNLFHYLFNIAS